MTAQMLIGANLRARSHFHLKGNFEFCPRAPFLRRETGKVVWVRSLDHLHQYRFQIRLRPMDISAFSGQNKVTKMCPKYLLTCYYK